jgi:hypothetical protein
LDTILNLKLWEVTCRKRPLEEVTDDISHKVQERGLTPELLKSILNEHSLRALSLTLTLLSARFCLNIQSLEKPFGLTLSNFCNTIQ